MVRPCEHKDKMFPKAKHIKPPYIVFQRNLLPLIVYLLLPQLGTRHNIGHPHNRTAANIVFHRRCCSTYMIYSTRSHTCPCSSILTSRPRQRCTRRLACSAVAGSSAAAVGAAVEGTSPPPRCPQLLNLLLLLGSSPAKAGVDANRREVHSLSWTGSTAEIRDQLHENVGQDSSVEPSFPMKSPHPSQPQQ